MGEIGFVVGQSVTGRFTVMGLVFFVALTLVLVFVWDLIRRIRRWFGRSAHVCDGRAR